MRRFAILLSSAALFWVLCGGFSARAGYMQAARPQPTFELPWWSVDGGGISFASGGSLTLGGTSGQADAGKHGVGASELPTLWIKPGSTSETPTLSTPMIMKACGGTVTIGQ